MEQEFYKNGYCGLISTFGIDKFCKLLIDQTPWLKHLTSFDLSNKNYDDESDNVKISWINEFTKVLIAEVYITHLNLADNNIKKEGAEFIAESLKINQSLEELHLDVNHFGDEGIEFIAKSLKTNRTLKKLYLDDCNISWKGIKYIADSLPICELLSLNENNIGDEGAKFISELLKTCKFLKKIIYRI